MRIKILSEHGHDEAIYGLSLSYNTTAERASERAPKLAEMDGGHNKFLESIVLWLDITAPRYFWQQFDTYRQGITKQSESTMHTLLRRPLAADNFESPLPSGTIEGLNAIIQKGQLDSLKNALPEGFLQRRIVCMNYKSLRNIIWQRRDHKLPEWGKFCYEILSTCSHPDYLL